MQRSIARQPMRLVTRTAVGAFDKRAKLLDVAKLLSGEGGSSDCVRLVPTRTRAIRKQIGNSGFITSRMNSRAKRKTSMCEKCIEIDEKIARYKRVAVSILDQATIDGLQILIERAEAEKKTLHPRR
jgi:hypothetical protein